ncbi:MAG TPA: helix-turn-helix domain-containing protein [Acidimicrobiales bacterium]|nr:helix-turn-helix domain-containing protein [Acidimicrobiales bacterium]
MTEPAARQLLDRPARRAAILRAAAVAFAEKGFAATSMEDVAAAAGITKLIIYRHFDSKQALYDAVLEQVADRLRDEFLSGLDTGRTASTAVHALLAVAREDPAAFTLLWRHASREPRFAEHARAIRARGVNVAARVLEPVAFRSPEVRAWAAEMIVSYLVESILQWLDAGDPSDDQTIADYLTRSLPAMVTAWSAPVRSG